MSDMSVADGGRRLLLAGGGSGGSTTPLLAVAQEVRRLRPEVELLYIGTAEGPERSLVERESIPFAAVQAGRLRRYLSLENVTDPVRVLVGIVQSVGIVRRFRPAVGFGAGGFASVPPLVACRLSNIPVVIHQQDVEPGLANRLLAPVSTQVSVSLEASLAHFPRAKVVLNGNPVRASVVAADRATAREQFGLEADLPTLLVTGGGTGALGVNRLIAQAASELVQFCQVIHLTGRGRQVPVEAILPRYHAYEFLAEAMPLALAAADLVVSRAGMATLTELAALGKPVVVIPMPASHQLANARAFASSGGALVREQESLSASELVLLMKELLAAPDKLREMGEAMRRAMPVGAAERLAQQLLVLMDARRG